MDLYNTPEQIAAASGIKLEDWELSAFELFASFDVRNIYKELSDLEFNLPRGVVDKIILHLFIGRPLKR